MNMPSSLPGRFITFEGIDGAGKSTQVEYVVATLQARGIPFVRTREPGGTPLSETLRGLLLSQDMALETEALLMFAARSEHLAQVIRPALARGEWVICDRFTDASYAYQVAGKGLPDEKFRTLEQWVHADLQPDMTFVFDLAPAIAGQRMAASRSTTDRFERESQDFFQRVRNGYLQRAAQYPERVKVLDASQSPDEVTAAVAHWLATLLPGTPA